MARNGHVSDLAGMSAGFNRRCRFHLGSGHLQEMSDTCTQQIEIH